MILRACWTIWPPWCTPPSHLTAIFCHRTLFLFAVPILSFSFSKCFFLFRSAPLFIPFCLFEYLFFFVSLILYLLFSPVFLFPLSYFFLSFRHSFAFLPIFISVYFIFSLLYLFVSFFFLPSLSIICSLSLILYSLPSLLITLSGHCCHLCPNCAITYNCRQFQHTACQVSLMFQFN